MPSQLNPTPTQLSNDTAKRLARADTLKYQILAVKGRRNIDNTLDPFNEMWAHLEDAHNRGYLLAAVHPDLTVRRQARRSAQQVATVMADVSIDAKLYQALRAVDLRHAGQGSRLMVEKVLRDFRREGAYADSTTRARIRQLNYDIIALGEEYRAAIREDCRTITLKSSEDLAGLPQAWIDAHPPAKDGTVEVSTDPDDFLPFRTYAVSGEARRALYQQFYNRGYPQNNDILTELLQARHEKAYLLGYPSWAAYVTEGKMVESARGVQTFIDEMVERSAVATQRDLAILLDRKRRDDPDATAIEEWDWHYYQHLVQKERFDVDLQRVREYLNFTDVRAGLFSISETLFGIEFRPVQGLALWHEDVTAWDIYDENVLVGRFYMDLFPRAGKYSHTASFSFGEPGIGDAVPQAVLVGNFTKPSDNLESSLMDHSEVVTLFHEFGRLLHDVLGAGQRWRVNDSNRAEWDFLEAPPLVLQQWASDYESMKIFARHYATGETIPIQMVENMRRAREFGDGVYRMRQLFYAAMSLKFHDTDPAVLDPQTEMVELYDQYYPFPYVDGAQPHCNFAHLDHYSALYYTFIWSKQIGAELFSEFARNGLFDRETARRYRQFVIDPGSSVKAKDRVRRFLDHDASTVSSSSG